MRIATVVNQYVPGPSAAESYNLISLAIWEGSQIIASTSWRDGWQYDGRPGYNEYHPVSMSYCGKYAALMAEDTFSNYSENRSGVLVLSDTGQIIELWSPRQRDEQSPLPGAQFTPDGWLYKWDGTERCKVGEWIPEPTGIPAAYSFIVDGANNAGWASYFNDIDPPWVYASELKRFDLSTHQEIPLGFDAPDGDQVRAFSVATSPTGDFIEVAASIGGMAPEYGGYRFVVDLRSGEKLMQRKERGYSADVGSRANFSALGAEGIIRIIPRGTHQSATTYIQVGELGNAEIRSAGELSGNPEGAIRAPALGYSAMPPVVTESGAVFVRRYVGGFGDIFYQVEFGTGALIAAPPAFQIQKVIPTPPGNYTNLVAAAAQPRILPPLPPGEVWSRFRYTQEA